jgi:formylglycine-generating enzyme required for sulfatase activity
MTTLHTILLSRQGVENRRQFKEQPFGEDLGNGITLDMVAIPGGTFTMGSSPNEEYSFDDEYPQHQVTVPSFFMGKYPITQA